MKRLGVYRSRGDPVAPSRRGRGLKRRRLCITRRKRGLKSRNPLEQRVVEGRPLFCLLFIRIPFVKYKAIWGPGHWPPRKGATIRPMVSSVRSTMPVCGVAQSGCERKEEPGALEISKVRTGFAFAAGSPIRHGRFGARS